MSARFVAIETGGCAPPVYVHPISRAEAEAIGWQPIGFVVDPERLRAYLPDLFVAEDGKCWALIP